MSKKILDTELNALHTQVAIVLKEQVGYEDAEITFDADGNALEGEKRYSASPATLAAAIKFLKDNQITCDIEQNENLNGLRETLKNKTRHSDMRDGKAAARAH